jgi:allantoinase
MPELTIRGASLVTGEGVQRSDLAVEDGYIAAIGPELPGAAREIDASNLTVFPGLIDVHVHFNEPGRSEWEGAASGSRALAAGGGTLFFDMPLNSSPCTVGPKEFDQKRAALEQSSITDFGLWGGLIPGNRGALAELAGRGVVGFKAFLCDSGLPEFPRADDLTLYEGMREAAGLGLPVAVHAESQEITQNLSARALAAGRHGIRDYLDSRPVIAEVEAIQRATLLAREALAGETGAKLHIVHVSSGAGVAAALEARARGVDVSIETCPHYLFFTESDMERIGSIAKCAPPLRDQAQRESLWEHLIRGEIDIIGSDHSPAPAEMKSDGNFFRVWGGIAGVQSTMAVLLSRGALPLEQIACLTATTPARRFRIRNKGQIAVGFDADLALVDLGAKFTLGEQDLFQRHRLSPYIGSDFRGAVRRTFLRGIEVGGSGATSPGRFVRPDLPAK